MPATTAMQGAYIPQYTHVQTAAVPVEVSMFYKRPEIRNVNIILFGFWLGKSVLKGKYCSCECAVNAICIKTIKCHYSQLIKPELPQRITCTYGSTVLRAIFSTSIAQANPVFCQT